jgi:hypothetical protein
MNIIKIGKYEVVAFRLPEDFNEPNVNIYKGGKWIAGFEYVNDDKIDKILNGQFSEDELIKWLGVRA